MKKRMISFILAVCLLVSMVPAMAVRGLAVSNVNYDEFRITFEQLFSSYPSYLSPQSESNIARNLSNTYTRALQMHEGESKSTQQALDVLCNKGLLEFTLESALTKLNLKDKEKELLWDTVLMLMNNIYRDKTVLAALSEKLGLNFDLLTTAVDLSTKVGQKIFIEHLKLQFPCIPSDDVEKIAKYVLDYKDKILSIADAGEVNDLIDLCDIIQSMFLLYSLEKGSLELLRDSVPKNSSFAEAIDMVEKNMEKNICVYFFQTYGDEVVVKAIIKLLENAPEIGPAVKIVNLISDCTNIAADVMRKNLGYATYTDMKRTLILSGYVGDLRAAVVGEREAFVAQVNAGSTIGLDEIEDYEFIYAAYMAAVKTAIDSAKSLVGDQHAAVMEDTIKLCDKLTFDMYLRLCLGALRADIDAGIVAPPSSLHGDPNACIVATYPASGTLTVTKENANIMDRPCSVNTDVNAQLIESGALNAKYTVTGSCVNTANNTWYIITTKSGQMGYIYSGNCTYAGASDATITGLDMPSSLEVGKRYWIKGTISAQNSTIVSVSCYVYDASGKQRTGGTANVNGKSYDLYRSDVDTLTEFNILGAGTYTWKISANVDVGNACQEVVLASGTLVVGNTTTSAGNVNAETIRQQVTDTYLKASHMLQAAGKGSSFDGLCGAYVGYQMYILGIINPCYAPNGCDSFDTYRYLSESSGGYRISAYPATNYSISSALNAITNNGTVNAYNIMLGFQKGYNKNPYGHCLFIHGIIDGVVYCSESFGFPSGGYHPEGSVLTYSFAQLENFYVSNGYEFEGAIHFQTKACSHNYVESVTKVATCTTEGTRKKTCTLCNDTITETIPALGHDYQETVVAPTCGSYGYTLRTCSRCDFSEALEPSEEHWSEWSAEKPENMPKELIRTRTEYKEVTTCAETSLEGWTKAGAASWTEYGDWSDWGITPITGSAATEVESATVWGYYYLLCPNCGAHMHGYGTCWTWADGCGAPTYNTGWREIWSPISWDSANLREFRGTGKYWTDTIDGNRVFQWTDNGHATTGYRSRTKTEVQGFNYYRWTEQEIDGAEERTVYRYYVGPLPEHSWKNDTCAVCGIHNPDYEEPTKPEKHEHSYTSKVTAPTCTEKGYTTYTCACGESYKDDYTKAKGHNYVDGICTRCGEDDPGYTEPEKPTKPEETGSVVRLTGGNRFETAFAVADALKEKLGVEKFDTIIVTYGANFPDALSGSYLAAVKNAPILLSFNKKYDDIAMDYIRENLRSGGTVYLLGEKNVVSASFEENLSAYNVKRLAGANRFETNLEVLKEAGVGDKPILVCTGLSFADSLSASAAKLPILLVWNNLTDGQRAFLDSLDGNKLYVIGGESAVSSSMAGQLTRYGQVERVAGSNRFETSVAIAETFFDAPESAVLAYAWNFPDGLCGGALAAAMDAPLILTMDKYEARAAEYIQDKTIKNGFILGGTGLISEGSVTTIFDK